MLDFILKIKNKKEIQSNNNNNKQIKQDNDRNKKHSLMD